MFGSMLINTQVSMRHNAWKLWIDHIMKHKQKFALKKAAMVHDDGTMGSCTSKFMFSAKDIKTLVSFFDYEDSHEREMEKRDTVCVRDKTYVIKTRTERQLIAFNGCKYLIVCRSGSMMIIIISESRTKYEDAAVWLRKVNKRLMEKGY